MRKERVALTPKQASSFCELCGWVHEVWLHDRDLFDCNPRKDELSNASFTGPEFRRLRDISQEYSMLQIAKLHDKALVQGKPTLGINYVADCCLWSPCVEKKLKDLKGTLSDFAKPICNARHQLLAHNDLDVFKKSVYLGAFGEGKDVKYFNNLWCFVQIVRDEILGGPCVAFDTLVSNDVIAFLAAIKPECASNQTDEL